MWGVSSAWIPSDDQGHHGRSQKPSDVSSGGWQGTLWLKLRNCWDGSVSLKARPKGNR